MSRDNGLSASPLLLGLSADETAGLLRVSERRGHGAGDLIVREGTASDCLFILEAGGVHVERRSDSRRVVLATLDVPGDFFGEMSLIDILPRSADIRAMGDGAVVRAFPKQQLTSFFSSSPRVQMTMILNIARNLSLRLREADTLIVELTSRQAG